MIWHEKPATGDAGAGFIPGADSAYPDSAESPAEFAEVDRFCAENTALRTKNAALQAENAAIIAERDALLERNEVLARDICLLTEDLNAAHTERDALAAERDEYKDASERDPLTGLYNLRGWSDRTIALIAAGRSVGVAVLDINEFGVVNKELGMIAGNRMLRDLARRILRRKDDCTGRFGGDEFVASFPLDGDGPDFIGADGRVLDPREAMYQMQTHLRAGGDAFVAAQDPEAQRLKLGVAIGAAGILGAATTVAEAETILEQLIVRADIAMRRNKLMQFPEPTVEQAEKLGDIFAEVEEMGFALSSLGKVAKVIQLRKARANHPSQPVIYDTNWSAAA